MTSVPITRTTLYFAWIGYRLPRKPIVPASCDLPERVLVDDPSTGRRASIAYLRGYWTPTTLLIDDADAPEIVRRYIEKALAIKQEATQLHRTLGMCCTEEITLIFPTYVVMDDMDVIDAPVMPLDFALDRLHLLALRGVSRKLIERGQRWGILD